MNPPGTSVAVKCADCERPLDVLRDATVWVDRKRYCAKCSATRQGSGEAGNGSSFQKIPCTECDGYSRGDGSNWHKPRCSQYPRTPDACPWGGGGACDCFVSLGETGRQHPDSTPRPSEAVPVCSTCNDTHVMQLENQGDVPCTHCPRPCFGCSSGPGYGPYCATTPCDCECHGDRGTQRTNDAQLGGPNGVSLCLLRVDAENLCALPRGHKEQRCKPAQWGPFEQRTDSAKVDGCEPTRCEHDVEEQWRAAIEAAAQAVEAGYITAGLGYRAPPQAPDRNIVYRDEAVALIRKLASKGLPRTEPAVPECAVCECRPATMCRECYVDDTAAHGHELADLRAIRSAAADYCVSGGAGLLSDLRKALGLPATPRPAPVVDRPAPPPPGPRYDDRVHIEKGRLIASYPLVPTNAVELDAEDVCAIAGSGSREVSPLDRAFGAFPDFPLPETKAFWEEVRKSAEHVKDAPAWKKAGVDINPQHFETYQPEPEPRRERAGIRVDASHLPTIVDLLEDENAALKAEQDTMGMRIVELANQLAIESHMHELFKAANATTAEQRDAAMLRVAALESALKGLRDAVNQRGVLLTDGTYETMCEALKPVLVLLGPCAPLSSGGGESR